MAETSKFTPILFLGHCCAKKLPCAFYRLPGGSTIQVMAQTTPVIKSGPAPGECGFVFAPFVEDKKFKKVFIKAGIFADADKLPALKATGTAKHKELHPQSGFKHIVFTKGEFKSYVRKIRSNIRKGKLAKVVAARTALEKKPTGFEPVAFFERLCKIYPTAFVSLVYTPQYGVWIGASPEVLLQADDKAFKTYSLAGTKANNKSNAKTAWGKKEKEEQQLVSDFIAKCLKKVTGKKPVVEGPVTAAAGNLLHLRSTFLYKALPVSLWQKVVRHLHPTPAVAGLPRKRAIYFILKNEPSPRGFYSGYLGPVNTGEGINLFVNLRCLQVLENKLALYVGCGVTKDSDPELEWRESKIKTQTLLNVLNAPNTI